MTSIPPGGGAPRSGPTPGAQLRCEGTTKRGTPCRSFALPGQARCISHDPARAEAVRAARAKGGAAASRLRSLEGRRAQLDTPARLLRFTSNVIHDTAEGRLNPDTARAVLYGISIASKLVDTADLERRVVALEQARKGPAA